jgi:replicative DNA helicase
LSSNSVSKEGFVQKELRYAREISLEKPEGAIFLIPVRLDECDVPRGLRFIQWTDYFGENREQSYSSLLKIFSKRYQHLIQNIEENTPLNINNVQQKDPQPIQNVLSDYYDQIDNFSSHPDTAYGVPTGFIDLDKLTNGLKPSSLLVVASRASQHKTNFLLSILKNAALTHKKHIAVFQPLGVSNNEIVQHLIVQETGLDPHYLSVGKLTADDWPLFTHAVEVMADTHIFLDDSPVLTLQSIQEKSRRLILENRIDLIIIDNLQYLSKNENTVNPAKDLSYITLKLLARELNVPVLVGVQLTKAGDKRMDKRPQLSDLHEFDQLEDLADVIMFIHHPDRYEVDVEVANIAEVIVAKHNSGSVGTIALLYRSALAKYENAAVRILNKETPQGE